MKKTSLVLLLGVSLWGGCANSADTSTSPGSTSSVPPVTSPTALGGSLVVAQNGNLVKLDRAGQNPQTLTRGFEDSHPAFRPDGSDLIFSRKTSSGKVDIFRIRPDGTGLVDLTPDFPMDAEDADYSWDGQRIAFSARVGTDEQDIYLMNADGTGIVRVTSGSERDRRPAFSPDGTRLVFERGNRICRVATTGGPVTNLTDGSAVDTFPSYCPPGDLVVFSRQGELWTVENGTVVKQLTNTPAHAEFQARHSQEHDAIYTLASTSAPTTGDVFVMQPDGSQQRQLTTTLQASYLTVGPSSNKWTAKAPYPASFNPFSHAVGVCYGHFSGRTGTVQADMDLLVKTEGFKMIHIYNLFSEGSLSADPDMKAVMDYAAAQTPPVEILLGTLNSEVSGRLSTAAGATAYVAALKPYLDTGVIKVIGLGNEPNAKGAANLAPGVWTTAAQNLRAALTAAGYSTPISACLVFGGLTSYPPAQARFQDDSNMYSMQGYMQAINSVNSQPFVFVNILPSFTVNDVVRDVPVTASWYPQFGLFTSTTNPANNDGNVAPYWDLADLQYNCVRTALASAGLSNIQVFISESGWPSASGGTYATPTNEALFVNNLLNLWIRPQMTAGGPVPVFLFEAFDEPTQGGNSAWGIHDVNGTLKPGIVLPSFISQ